MTLDQDLIILEEIAALASPEQAAALRRVAEVAKYAPGVPDVLRRSFMTAESGYGVYRLLIRFRSLRDMQESHDYLARMFGSTVQPPADDKRGGRCGAALLYLFATANRIEAEAEECDGPDGLCVSIGMDHWHEFTDALERARDKFAKKIRQPLAESADGGEV